jgi:hypothetical protein
MNNQARTQLTIPKPKWAVVVLFVTTLSILFFVAVAVNNLLNRIAFFPSLIWLTLVTAVFVDNWRSQDTRRFLTNILGAFSLKHFAEIADSKENSRFLRFGFSALWCRHFYQAIPINKIESIEWHSGQATNLAGRDMNDWHVILWFDHGDPAKSEKQKKLYRKPDQDIYIIGPSRAKELTAAFGWEVLAFLEAAGVRLIQGKDDCTFVRESNKNGEHPTKPSTATA